MFLTRITLNPERSKTHQFVSNPRALHAAIEKSFPDDGSRVLWKLDVSKRDPQVFVLSSAIPSVEHIIEQAGRGNDATGVITKNYNSVLGNITKDRIYRFQSELNITKTVKGKRVPLYKNNEIENWLQNQGVNNGFKIVSPLLIEPKQPLIVSKDSHKVTLERTLIDCKVQVIDEVLFCQLLQNGLGRGKAYGLGMVFLGKP